jgi:hypothetical protein
MCHFLSIGMTRDRIRGYCPRCSHSQLFNRSEIHHGIHLFVTILTCGLWLVSWIAVIVGHRIRPWRCQQCGWAKPIFDGPDLKPAAGARTERAATKPNDSSDCAV